MNDYLFGLSKLGGYLISPLTLVLALGATALACLVFRRRGWATGLSLGAVMLLWVCSTPALAMLLNGALEAQYPAQTIEQTPTADAILVLGGALVGAMPPERPYFELGGGANRVWHAARLHKAGKAKWLVISGGNQPENGSQQAEGDAIAEMLVELGIPASALLRETGSRNTVENAQRILPVLQRIHARRILLVTSAQHMPRALKTFAWAWRETGMLTIPAVTDVRSAGGFPGWKLWLPSLDGLITVTSGVKEIASTAALAIISGSQID